MAVLDVNSKFANNKSAKTAADVMRKDGMLVQPDITRPITSRSPISQLPIEMAAKAGETPKFTMNDAHESNKAAVDVDIGARDNGVKTGNNGVKIEEKLYEATNSRIVPSSSNPAIPCPPSSPILAVHSSIDAKYARRNTIDKTSNISKVVENIKIENNMSMESVKKSGPAVHPSAQLPMKIAVKNGRITKVPNNAVNKIVKPVGLAMKSAGQSANMKSSSSSSHTSSKKMNKAVSITKPKMINSRVAEMFKSAKSATAAVRDENKSAKTAMAAMKDMNKSDNISMRLARWYNPAYLRSP